ncbi:MAG: hypothetical protein IPM18_16955 [Phycisphaerales bacterium]|nr:hypothetical protein [Phycisphaerales bacterium]
MTQVFESPAPATLWVTFEDGRTLGLTPGHEVWTFEAGWTAAGRLVPKGLPRW